VAIDEEIRRIVEENYRRTREILEQNRAALVKVSEALLERENLDGSEIREMVFGPAAEAAAAGVSFAPAAGPCSQPE